MPKTRKRLLGISNVRGHQETLDFDITIAVDREEPIEAIANLPVIEQMLPVLSLLAQAVREQLSGTAQVVVAQDVSQVTVEKDPWQDQIVIRFLSPEGIPHTFAVPPKNALEIADRLKSEAAKPHRVGQA
jgi:hypothetical protein